MQSTSQFFQEDNGNFSITRVLVAALVAYGIIGSSFVLAFGLYKYIQPDSHETLLAVVTAASAFVSSIAAIAAGWKVMQKSQEVKPLDVVKAE